MFFDVGGNSHSAGVNNIPPRFIPELDAFWFTRHSNDLANATAFKTNDVQKAAPMIRAALRFFQIFLPNEASSLAVSDGHTVQCSASSRCRSGRPSSDCVVIGNHFRRNLKQ
jgi:hypothetical protein